MGLLLKDDVFVDFFNTFLNLPVSPLCTIKPGTFLSSSQVNFFSFCGVRGPRKKWEYNTLGLESEGNLRTSSLEIEV